MVVFLEFDGKENLKVAQNITGIINSPVVSFSTKTKKTMARFGVMLPCRTQIIIEIWSQKENSTPKFAKKWQVLQLIAIFNVYYGGETLIEGKTYKIFRMGCKHENRYGKFIWLSQDSENFWFQPISQHDMSVNLRSLARDSWPRRVPFGAGILRKSKGSIITKQWAKFYLNWHTREYETFCFQDMVDLHEYVKRGVHGFLNFLTRKPMHKSANFEK